VKHEMKLNFNSLNPERIERYLISCGWVNDGSLGALANIWHRSGEDEAGFELVVPISSNARDYEERIEDVIRNLGDFEGRSITAIADAIINLAADQISIRVTHEDVAEGSIPLQDGIELNINARELMVSAVMTTISKRKTFQGARPPEATSYLKELRLGQTGVGSYIVNIVAPYLKQENEKQIAESLSFSSLVTSNLAAALTSLKNRLPEFDASLDYRVFDDCVIRGASLNMCEALVGLSGEGRKREFQISISPAAAQNLITSESTYRFEFGTKEIELLERAKEYFKDNYVLPQQTIRGYVKRLDRDSKAESGTITISATVNYVEKNVTVELGEESYRLAIHAHEDKTLVECTGDVHVAPKSAKLLSPEKFRIITNGELFEK
jgi:hypothetical protein